jgi:hypothetical protein
MTFALREILLVLPFTLSLLLQFLFHNLNFTKEPIPSRGALP